MTKLAAGPCIAHCLRTCDDSTPKDGNQENEKDDQRRRMGGLFLQKPHAEMVEDPPLRGCIISASGIVELDLYKENDFSAYPNSATCSWDAG